ncbi:MAG: alpha/beta hydrolase [Promethearchaeota archaeon]
MVIREHLFIGNGPIKLEAEWFDSNISSLPAALIIHPHPQFGGTMHNNVVSAIFEKCIEENVSCLRFNFRGVGKSMGTYSNGRGELSDVKACIDFLIHEKKKARIVIIGYSYGAAIGCSGVNYSESIIGYVAISFPWDFMGKKYKKLSNSGKPKLFIQGTNDTIALLDRFHAHFADYSDPKEYHIIQGADHFYWGQEREISRLVIVFLKKL